MRYKLRLIWPIVAIFAMLSIAPVADAKTCGACQTEYLSCISRGSGLDQCGSALKHCEAVCRSSGDESSAGESRGSSYGDNPFIVGGALGLLVACAIWMFASIGQSSGAKFYRRALWLSGIAVGCVVALGAFAYFSQRSKGRIDPEIQETVLLAFAAFCLVHLVPILVIWKKWKKEGAALQPDRLPAMLKGMGLDEYLEGSRDLIKRATVEELANATNRTQRGIRVALTRRGVDCADYKGAEAQARANSKSRSP